MKYIILVLLAACSANNLYYGDCNHNHVISTDAEAYTDCSKAVGQFSDEGTDLWEEQMDSCVFHDPDYLNVPFQVEGEEQ